MQKVPLSDLEKCDFRESSVQVEDPEGWAFVGEFILSAKESEIIAKCGQVSFLSSSLQ